MTLLVADNPYLAFAKAAKALGVDVVDCSSGGNTPTMARPAHKYVSTFEGTEYAQPFAAADALPPKLSGLKLSGYSALA